MTTSDLYDVVAYPASSYENTHPDTLAVIGLLHGLSVAPVESCRVLEIGCNEGANLIPMAYAIPGSQFVGFDLAAQPIARGRQRIQQLGLTNIQIFQANLMEVGDTLGTFDYIIAHGVYAWVAEPIRDGLLALCQRCLAPNGIAFVSYNALPGSHIKNLLGEILLQGMAGIEDVNQSIQQGIAFLEIVTESQAADNPLRAVLEKELERIAKRPHAVFHDELSPGHRPVSFTAFAAHASRHSLLYLGESTLPPPTDAACKPQLAQMARSLSGGDSIAEEQVLDTLRLRRYRETLLCHADRSISRDLTLEFLDRLSLSTPAIASAGAEPGTRIFTLPPGTAMESLHPTTILLMDHVIEAWPQSIPVTQVLEFLSAQDVPLDADLFKLLMQLVVSRFLQFHAWSAPVSHELGVYPYVSAIARQQPDQFITFTTLLHTTLNLTDPLVLHLLRLLDGTRDRTSLLEALQSAYPERSLKELSEGLEPTLRLLHRSGMLLKDGNR